MGLDITAFANLEKAKGNEAFDETGELIWNAGWVQLFINPSFPKQAKGIDDRCAYKYSDSFHFYAGGYSGYNLWRENLAILVGYPPILTNQWGKQTPSHAGYVQQHSDDFQGPFAELINFSDCEGVMGSEICAKLAEDFAEYQSKVDTHGDEYFRKQYANWRKAFELASNKGAVKFS